MKSILKYLPLSTLLGALFAAIEGDKAGAKSAGFQALITSLLNYVNDTIKNPASAAAQSLVGPIENLIYNLQAILNRLKAANNGV